MMTALRIFVEQLARRLVWGLIVNGDQTHEVHLRQLLYKLRRGQGLCDYAQFFQQQSMYALLQ